MRACLSCRSEEIVRMLCRRSPSLMTSTRMSRAHRDDHLADRLGLRGLAVDHLVELGDAVDHRGDFLAEVGRQLGQRVARVLHRVVQQRGADRGLGQPQAGEDRRDRQRVRDVGVTALAGLPLVVVLGRAVGALDQRRVDLGVVLAHRREQRVQGGGGGRLLRAEQGEHAPDAATRLVEDGLGRGPGRPAPRGRVGRTARWRAGWWFRSCPHLPSWWTESSAACPVRFRCPAEGVACGSAGRPRARHRS